MTVTATTLCVRDVCAQLKDFLMKCCVAMRKYSTIFIINLSLCSKHCEHIFDGAPKSNSQTESMIKGCKRSP